MHLADILVYLALLAGVVLALPALALFVLAMEARHGGLLPEDAIVFGTALSAAASGSRAAMKDSLDATPFDRTTAVRAQRDRVTDS